MTGIDFRDPANRRTYSDREADTSWRDAVTAQVDPVGARVVDIGCGGGTYLRAWHDLGVATVAGVDSSEPILDAARESHGHLAGASFHLGDAADSGLDAESADVVFERALIHIAARTGRSILHELTDDEPPDLVAELRRRLPDGPMAEQDRWTLWRAVRRSPHLSGSSRTRTGWSSSIGSR